jgi:hydrogenase nickel incorporation protein HypA/HybF
MHELSLAQSVVEMVDELAKKEGFKKVHRLRLGVGAMSGVVKESLEFCFSLLIQGTILEGTALEMIDIPLKIRCRACKAECQVNPDDIRCTDCGSGSVEVKEGRDFKVIDLDVDGMS